MEKDTNFDLFYDVLDDSIVALYKIKHDNFFNLLIQTGNNIIASEVLNSDCSDEQREELEKIYSRLEGVDFNVETVRQAFQAMSLRAFKETNLKLGEVTPDTLGIFFSYLVSKLKKDAKKLTILDPVVGTGNLLYSLANSLDMELKLYGIDNVREVLEIANVLGNLLNYDVEMFNQDTLTHPFSDIDIVVADLPDYYAKDYDNRYFPHLCVLEHLSSLKEDGYMIALVPNDFFEKDQDKFFKERLKGNGSVLGVLQLPLEMFKENPKSIVIFSKKEVESKKCLLVDLPSFTDFNKLNRSLVEIENWFDKNIYYKEEV